MTPPFSFRPATIDDGEFVLALFARDHVRPFAHGPRSIEDYASSLGKPGKENLILERAGEPFGNLCLGTAMPWLLEFQVIAVWENGAGAGRYAMQYAIWRAFDDLGANRIYLEVVAENARARALYERAGFTAEGLFRSGYEADDGTFHDMIPYGMLASDPRQSFLK
ncbi:MAG TPA: GNAT family protein [Candidatus Acidoferrales bacterium]|nr:GNAT family protein [Candidatus Acidoferrales bacterium]